MTAQNTITKVWTEKDDEFLRRNAGLLNATELAEALKRSKTAISLRAHILKISLRCVHAGWCAEDQSTLIELKDSGRTWAEIADHFERSSEACRKAYIRAVKKRDYTKCFKESTTNADFAEYTYQLFNILKGSSLADEHKDLLSQIESSLTNEAICGVELDTPQVSAEQGT